MRVCEWCKIRLAFDGELCSDCTLVLAPKNQAEAAHAAIDSHVDSCVICRHTGCCTEGSKLRVEAVALDGKIDKEYAATFGSIDPQRWFWNQAHEERPFPPG